ncbi:ABC transporter ATP-binding protein [Pelotomaculum isophthalicicum JI]|uniref:ABC transporter ATP-binding protein n=1 Tax=Pelotomaculum isophthalicicum JI TaxID=947010 RepID=A0A9X4H7F7_9FIRM|nr:ABC transporter ATP-binding protein [Pelotomaculum isophthalicicum]MDF9409449.1 ABC transporter ATP-binding protein [Pelotomaculum isophthalicicum JI]
MSEKVIEVKDLSLTKGKNKILDIEYFSLNQGEIVALIGPNGAGKSTLLQVLMLLQRPTGGELFFKGEIVDWKKPIKQRRLMAMVFQEPLLLDTTVYNNIASGLKVRGLPMEKSRVPVTEWSQRLGIEHLIHRSVRHLSGGESQRVSLARALVLEPKVLFLDEPFSALDAPTRTALTVELGRILRDTGISCVFVTHDFSEIPLLASRVVVLEKGRIIQTAAPREILTRPASRTVASLVGIENMLPGTVVEKDGRGVFVQVDQNTIRVSGSMADVGDTVHVLLRPEDISVSTTPGKVVDGANIVSGKIRELLSLGFQYKATIDCGFPLVTIINPDQVFDGNMGMGQEVYLSFSPDKAHLINDER